MAWSITNKMTSKIRGQFAQVEVAWTDPSSMVLKRQIHQIPNQLASSARITYLSATEEADSILRVPMINAKIPINKKRYSRGIITSWASLRAPAIASHSCGTKMATDKEEWEGISLHNWIQKIAINNSNRHSSTRHSLRVACPPNPLWSTVERSLSHLFLRTSRCSKMLKCPSSSTWVTWENPTISTFIKNLIQILYQPHSPAIMPQIASDCIRDSIKTNLCTRRISWIRLSNNLCCTKLSSRKRA